MIAIKKVIFLIESPFNKRDKERFGIEIFENSGFMVEIWDLTPFLSPIVFKSYTVPDPTAHSGYRQFFSKMAVISSISKLSEFCFFVPVIDFRLMSYRIFLEISKKCFPFGVLVTNQIPLVENRNFDIFSKLKKLSLSKMVQFFFPRIPLKFLGIKEADYILAGGSRLPKNIPFYGKKTEIIWGHALDYDLFLEERRKTDCSPVPYAVFLDSFWPFHPDFLTRPEANIPKDFFFLL